MASPVPPAFSWSPMPPSPASPSCSSTLWRGLLGGLCIGAVAVVVLFICCVKINRQRETAPSQNGQRETAPSQNGQRETPPSQQRETPPTQNRQRETAPTQNRQRETPPSQNRQRETPPPNASTASAPRRAGKRIFTFREVKSFTKDFSSLLGEGGSANVYKGALSTGEEVAVKQLTRGGGQEFETEVEKLSRAHHKHVVSLVGYCIEEGQQIVVYEYVPNNTLKFHLHGAGRRDLNWPERLKIALGSAKGLAYLHEYCHPKIIHRDIKATNILLDRDFEAKIADFGLAKCISESETHVSTAVKGTPGYLDPEYWQSSQLTEKTDIYSFGMVLLQLITGRKLEEGQGGLYNWVWSQLQLPRDLKDGNFDSLVDPRLQNVYNRREMARMVRCAVACVYHFSNVRPKMSEIVRALEGHPDLPQSPTHLHFREGPGPSSDAPAKASKCPEKTPLGNQKNGSSHHREPTPGSRKAGPSRPPS
ncbi:hypothetical protein ACJRO7_016292 [Eucalyptus globulus]|uniref:non-specific serine/threonine protein kinase n=1 Tax=Eucalyptus globulus TaxID=34317 RepID=A0ABD3L6M0_EUCGL